MAGDRRDVRNSIVIVTALSWVNGPSSQHETETSLPVPRNLATLNAKQENDDCETCDGAETHALQ
jgi:hypothetical protein